MCRGGRGRTTDFGSWARRVSITLLRGFTTVVYFLCIQEFFDLIYPFTSYTFPYSYLVTTSFQLQTYPRVAFTSVRIAKIPLSQPLWQAYFQTVTGGLYRTPEPVHRSLADLRLLAIPTSRVSNCRKRFVLRRHLFRGAFSRALLL